MRLQLIKDSKGKNTGVFISLEDWTLIKNKYPNIENADNELDQSEKDLIDIRLDEIENNSQSLKSGEFLFEELKRSI